jgi:hypothetical protein
MVFQRNSINKIEKLLTKSVGIHKLHMVFQRNSINKIEKLLTKSVGIHKQFLNQAEIPGFWNPGIYS